MQLYIISISKLFMNPLIEGHEHNLADNTSFPIHGEVYTTFLSKVHPCAETISPETSDIGVCLTTQHVRNGTLWGGGDYNIFSYTKGNV